MQKLRAVHRAVTIALAGFLVFLAVTGTLIQAIDLRSIAIGLPARDPNVQAMREAFDGPAGYAVRRTADYDTAALPVGFDYAAALPRVVAAARTAVGPRPLAWVEFRMANGSPIGQVGIDRGHLRVDPANGAVLERTGADAVESQTPVSLRNDFKHLHRMTTFGNWALYINVVVSAGLATLIATGAIIYWKLIRARRRLRRRAPFWSGGGTWRSLHRSLSIVAAAFLAVVALSGAWLAVESLGMGFFIAGHHARSGGPEPRLPGNELRPADDAGLPAMLGTTLAALRRDAADAPVKVLRLRRYAGYPQGIVVTGGGDGRQRVYHAGTGRAMSTTEPGYPAVGFPFGWQAHQVAKSIHRGDWFGLTGRIMDLLSGLALAYLSVSGIIMYYSMWRRRRQSGRGRLIWAR